MASSVEQLNIIEVGVRGAEVWGCVAAGPQGCQGRGQGAEDQCQGGYPQPPVRPGLGPMGERPGPTSPDVPENQWGLQMAPKEGPNPGPSLESQIRNL